MSKSLPTRSFNHNGGIDKMTAISDEKSYLLSLDDATNLRLRRNKDNSYSVEVVPEELSLSTQQGQLSKGLHRSPPTLLPNRRYSDDEISVQSSVTSPLYEKVPPLKQQRGPQINRISNGFDTDPKVYNSDSPMRSASQIMEKSGIQDKVIGVQVRGDTGRNDALETTESSPRWSEISSSLIDIVPQTNKPNLNSVTTATVGSVDQPKQHVDGITAQNMPNDKSNLLHFSVSKGETGAVHKFVISQLEPGQQAVLFTDENVSRLSLDNDISVYLQNGCLLTSRKDVTLPQLRRALESSELTTKRKMFTSKWSKAKRSKLKDVAEDNETTADDIFLSGQIGDEKSELTKALKQLRGVKSSPSPWLKIKKLLVLFLSFILPFRIYNFLFRGPGDPQTPNILSRVKTFIVRLTISLVNAIISRAKVLVLYVLGWILPFKLYQLLVSSLDKFGNTVQTPAPNKISKEEQPLQYANELKILNYRIMTIVERPVMKTFGVLGKLFDFGKSLLPKLIKLWYYFANLFSEQVLTFDGKADSKGTIVLATVQGDVHDIGKNIVGVIMESNNFKVIDVGVSTPASKIIQTAIEERADLVGLSGLVAPSLDHMVHVAKEMEKAGLNIPMLIGGAATSRVHTARKIAPYYSHPVVYVPTAYKSVDVATRLLDPEEKNLFLKEIYEEYSKIRAEHNDVTMVTKYVSIEHARGRKPKIDWFADNPVGPPMFLGRKAFLDYDLNRLIPYIDWKPFFDVWQLHGKYPNRGYPKIFDDKDVGQEARKLYDDAKTMLTSIINKNKLKAHGVVAFFPANSEGDDIEVYGENGDVIAVLHGLRQQTDKGTSSESYLCLADFIAPKRTGIKDHIGLFAVTAGFGVDEICRQYNGGPGRDKDNYSIIMVKALADRLAEAFAEELHERVRKELWGYSSCEELGKEDLHKITYQGIRPAPGYPSQPDHSEKQIMWGLIQADKVGITLTDTMTMDPPASVSGLYFAHPKSFYFATGKINRDQVKDYAARKQMDVADVERWLSSVLAYDV